MKKTVLSTLLTLLVLTGCKKETKSNTTNNDVKTTSTETPVESLSNEEKEENLDNAIKVFSQGYEIQIADATQEAFNKLKVSKFEDFNFQNKQECIKNGRLVILNKNDFKVKLKNGSYATFLKGDGRGYWLDEGFGYDPIRNFYIAWQDEEEGGQYTLIDGVTGKTKMLSHEKKDITASPNKKVISNVINWDAQFYKHQNKMVKIFNLNFQDLLNKKWSIQEIRWVNGNTFIAKMTSDNLFKKILFKKMNEKQLAINNEKIKKTEQKVLDLSNKGDLTKALKVFKQLLNSDPKGTFKYSFKKLKDNYIMNVLTSSDNKVRFYSWNDGTGGTWKYYGGAYQINDEGFVNTVSFPKNTKNYSNNYIKEVHTIKSEKENFYITIEQGTYSTNTSELVAKAHGISSIVDNFLYPNKLFKTSKKSYSEISVSFNPTTLGNKKVIKVANNSVQFAVAKGKTVTNKYLNYIWKGKYFLYDGVK